MTLGPLAFINPWILAALAALPLLWLILRVTPPPPKKIKFPAARFLAGLLPEKTTPDHTPWWLLLLRCLIAALVILALAGPVLHPAKTLSTQDDVRIVIDNGWAAAKTWDLQIKTAQDIIAQAGRDGRDIYITTTALEAGTGQPVIRGPLTKGQADAALRTLEPKPWPADPELLANILQENSQQTTLLSYWLGHGLDDGGVDKAIRALQSQGGVILLEPEENLRPALLEPPEDPSADLRAQIHVAEHDKPLSFSVQVTGADGNILDLQRARIESGKTTQDVTFDLADTLRNTVSRIELGGRRGAGGVLLLDESNKRRVVGLVAEKNEDQSFPLTEAPYYLSRALEPYTALNQGSIEEMLDLEPSMIILPDIGAMPPSTLDRMENWVRDGGVLLRFAGPNMAQADSVLTPVPLRRGERALEGSLTWDEPQTLAPFPETSPFHGLDLRDTVTVKRQILSEPVSDLETKTWASLTDGTPLITSDVLGKGRIVLVHTTASPEWSDLALSGLYVDILRRIVALSSGVQQNAPENVSLQPIAVLDGFGTLQPPKGVQPIAAQDLETLIPGPENPPGLYGRSGYQVAVNLGGRIKTLKTIGDLPSGVERQTYGGSHETDLMPYLLAAALSLFLIDWIIMIAMGMTLFAFRKAPAAILIFTLLFSFPAQAQESGNDIAYAGTLHLAYIRTGDSSVDQTTHAGMEALAKILKRRTSVEPEGVVGLNPETDEMAFFPFIYWPITQTPQDLSDQALQNIQYYLDHGGTILLDTRDQSYAINTQNGFGSTANARALREMIGSLNIPALAPIPENHVLSKSFYLLKSFPGRYDGGTIWVEELSVNGRDGVSSVIIGSHDWASAWAAEQSGGRLRPSMSGGPRQHEMAMRFGVNLMMYALTGNYKADQVHVPFILERLGQ